MISVVCYKDLEKAYMLLKETLKRCSTVSELNMRRRCVNCGYGNLPVKVKYAHFQWVVSSWVTSLVLIIRPLLSIKQQNYSISSLDIQ